VRPLSGREASPGHGAPGDDVPARRPAAGPARLLAPARLPSVLSDEVFTRTAILMDTFVAIEVVAPKGAPEPSAAMERALGWFAEVEVRCSRFDPKSEVMRLTRLAGSPVRVSKLLFEVVRFALTIAEASGGAFDPAVGHVLEARGFNRDYRTGQAVDSGLAPEARPTYRDVRLDPAHSTITLKRPLILDLGGVAKGMAIDLAAKELAQYSDFAVDAGGDLYLKGRNPLGRPWRVGIRDPRNEEGLLETLQVSDAAICTSGDYERRAPDESGGHHILDPRTGESADEVASTSVVAPTAMVADALATAAFVLGPERGIRFLERQGVAGLIISPSLERHATADLARYTVTR
jgi:FAD:protein FMN transferase